MNWLLYILAGAASGVLSGMGIGGGVLLIPALVLLGGIAQHSAQGINLLYFLPTAIGALWIHRKERQLEKKVLPMLIVGGVLGAAAGGAAISAGLGYAPVPIVGAVIAAAGLALVGLHVVQRRARLAMNP